MLLGYENVRQYWGGLGEWKEQGRYLVVETPAVVASLVESGAVLIDVRDAADFAEGHIPGARNVTPNVLQIDPAAALPGVGPEDTVLVYDSSDAMIARVVNDKNSHFVFHS